METACCVLRAAWLFYSYAARSTQPAAVSRVHRLDQRSVALLNHAPLDLERRRQRAVLDRPRLAQKLEALHLLPLREPAIDRIDLRLHERARLLRRVHRRAGHEPALEQPLLERRGVRHDERAAERHAVADHHRLLDE